MALGILLTVGMIVGLASTQFQTPGLPDICLPVSSFHKETPTIETEGNFDVCAAWQNKEACCTNVTRRIISGRLGVYNYSSEECGPLSEKCERYLQHAECFFNCDPSVVYFVVEGSSMIYRLPICASYCDEWFDACKDDSTCVVNWFVRLQIYAETGKNACPCNYRCQTFAEAYGSGEGLCNRMWGTSFAYSEDEDNCTVMNFATDSPNPNLRLSFPVNDSGTPGKHISCLTMIITVVIGLIAFNFM